jgi:hypothetical protein
MKINPGRKNLMAERSNSTKPTPRRVPADHLPETLKSPRPGFGLKAELKRGQAFVWRRLSGSMYLAVHAERWGTISVLIPGLRPGLTRLDATELLEAIRLRFEEIKRNKVKPVQTD